MSTKKSLEIKPDMKTIIVPLDFSVDSLKGLEMALLFGRRFPVKIQLVHVQRRHDIPSQEEEEYRMAEKRLQKFIELFSKELHEDAHISYIIKKGKVYQEVVGQAEAFTDSIIIASTHGASGFEELFIGSNAYRIVCATSRPVITIRQLPVPQNITNILLPIDIAIDSRQKVVFVSALARLFGATVHVVTFSASTNKKVVSRLNGYANQTIDYLKNKDVPYVSYSLVGANGLNDLFDYAVERKCELLSVVNESGTSFTDLIMGSIAQQLISKSPVPVLTIRAKSRTIKDSFSTFAG
ncbi:MAG TPA: universal stress protein [Bacteroidales bacterium]|nr:universal stress protein [Bacteroidales bacterium]